MAAERTSGADRWNDVSAAGADQEPTRSKAMDLRVLVLTADLGLSELIRAQVENLGCVCTLRETYDDASSAIDWADAAIVDLVNDGIDDLCRLRVEAPRVRILAIAPDAVQERAATSAGADRVLVEPFAIAEVVEAVRALGPNHDAPVVDIRTGVAAEAPPVEEEAPWWASR
jgi:DNA-binding response OmpR family regulator